MTISITSIRSMAIIRARTTNISITNTNICTILSITTVKLTLEVGMTDGPLQCLRKAKRDGRKEEGKLTKVNKNTWLFRFRPSRILFLRTSGLVAVLLIIVATAWSGNFLPLGINLIIRSVTSISLSVSRSVCHSFQKWWDVTYPSPYRSTCSSCQDCLSGKSYL